MIEILWNVKTLGSYIFKIIYLIAVKFTGVMKQVVESLNINFQAKSKILQKCYYFNYIMAQ